MEDRASIAEPSTTSRTMKPSNVGGRFVLATSVTTAPPREWPIRRIGGVVGQENFVAVEFRMNCRSAARVVKVRSCGVKSDEDVRPWSRASRESIPAFGSRGVRAAKKAAKESPDEPAPWWVTRRGPLEEGGVK
jgi:hypothetical protein